MRSLSTLVRHAEQNFRDRLSALNRQPRIPSPSWREASPEHTSPSWNPGWPTNSTASSASSPPWPWTCSQRAHAGPADSAHDQLVYSTVDPGRAPRRPGPLHLPPRRQRRRVPPRRRPALTASRRENPGCVISRGWDTLLRVTMLPPAAPGEFAGPPAEPAELLRRWLADARAAGEADPSTAVLATADASGQPSTRCLAVRSCDERGL
jgi:hypothetical protein